MRSLYFIKPSRPYNPGEVAGFSPQTAQRLIDMGAAIPLEDRDAYVKEVAAEEAKKTSGRKPAKKAAKKSVKK